MKDKELYKRLDKLERETHDRIKALERTGISVKNCPKCGHLVLAIADWAEQLPLQMPRISHSHKCLTCGSEFTYKQTEQLIEQ